MKNNKKHRFVRTELDRLMFEVLHAARGLSAQAVAKRSDLSAQTISNIRRKQTRYPQAATLVAIARVAGLRLTTEHISTDLRAPVRLSAPVRRVSIEARH